MAKLLFKNEGLKKLFALNAGATEFRQSFDVAITAWEKANGRKYDFVNDVIGDEFYKTHKPTIYFVKDTGIYVMAGAKMDKVPADYSHVCYAEGYNPDVEDIWQKCRDAVGGDDIGETIEVTDSMKVAIEKGYDMMLHITPKAFSMSFHNSTKKKAA